MEKKLKSAEGFEIHFGTNHLGHFLLNKLMLEKNLINEEDGRIVMVSSSLMNFGKLDMEKQDFVYEGRQKEAGDKSRSFAPTGYCDTKLMNALYAQEMSEKLKGSSPNVRKVNRVLRFLYFKTFISSDRHLHRLPRLVQVQLGQRGRHADVQSRPVSPNPLHVHEICLERKSQHCQGKAHQKYLFGHLFCSLFTCGHAGHNIVRVGVVVLLLLGTKLKKVSFRGLRSTK